MTEMTMQRQMDNRRMEAQAALPALESAMFRMVDQMTALATYAAQIRDYVSTGQRETA